MKIGYARVSTDDQRLDLQIDALNQAGCEKIFTDKGISGSNFDRQGLDELICTLKPEDTLVVWRLDRLGRSLVKLVEFMNELGNKQIEFQSLTENINTGSSDGRLIFHMMAALAEFERSLISERTRAGMDAARNKGKHLGRPHSLSPNQVESARKAVVVDGRPVISVALEYNISSRSLYRLIRSDSGVP